MNTNRINRRLAQLSYADNEHNRESVSGCLSLPCGLNYMRKVLKFAKDTGQYDDIARKLYSLRTWSRDVQVYTDFAPMSFFWQAMSNGKAWIIGGLIYHGKHDGGGNGGPPTFSVNLTPLYGWAIHT